MKNNQELRTDRLAELDGELSIAIRKHDTAMIETHLAEVNTLAAAEQPLNLDLSLSSATFRHDTSLVARFLNIPGFNLKPRDIANAIKQNRADLIQVFVEHGLDLRNPLPNSLITEDLRKALKEQRPDVVQRDYNCDIPDHQDTPLTYAARLKKGDVIDVLAPLYSDEELTAAFSLFNQKTVYTDGDDCSDSDNENDSAPSSRNQTLKNRSETSRSSNVCYILVNGKMVTAQSTLSGEALPLPHDAEKIVAELEALLPKPVASSSSTEAQQQNTQSNPQQEAPREFKADSQQSYQQPPQPNDFSFDHTDAAPQTQPFFSASPETENTSYTAWGTSIAAASIIAAGAASAAFLQWLYNKIKQRLPKKTAAALV
jgi:hypothetical protein